MSLMNFFKERATQGAAAVALSVGLAGCSATAPTIRDVTNIPVFGGQIAAPTAQIGGLSSVHPSIKPRSCTTFEAAARRAPRNNATDGVAEVFGGLISGGRQGERKVQRGLERVISGAGQNADRQASLDIQRDLCYRDLQALFAPGGQCATRTTQFGTAQTVNGQQVGPATGQISQSQSCNSASRILSNPSLIMQ